MRRFIGLFLSAFVALAAAAEIRSPRTFALVDVEGSRANTIIAVPWSGFDGDIRIDHLVWPQGLTTGDMVLAVTNGVSYGAWILQAVPGSDTGAREWRPIATVKRNDSGREISILADNDGTGTVVRGSGLWLVRQNPGTAFSLHGILHASSASVTIPGGSTSVPTYMLLAHPDATRAVNVNSLAWPADKIGAKDLLVVSTGTSTSQNYLWDSKLGKWYYGKTSVQNGAIATEYVYDLADIPAGTGFWYVRRTAGDITIDFND